MGRRRTDNITLSISLRATPQFFDSLIEKANKYYGALSAYVMRVLKEREKVDRRRKEKLYRRSAARIGTYSG